MNDLMLSGLALAFIGGFAGMIDWLKKRQKRVKARHARIIERILDLPPQNAPKPFDKRARAFYARPPKSSDLLPWR
jgi:hypothetical protein